MNWPLLISCHGHLWVVLIRFLLLPFPHNGIITHFKVKKEQKLNSRVCHDKDWHNIHVIMYVSYCLFESLIGQSVLASLQIIFSYEQVICQVRGQFWPEKKPVWSDKNANQYEEIKSVNYILRIELFTYLQVKKRLQSGFKNIKRFSFHYMQW